MESVEAGVPEDELDLAEELADIAEDASFDELDDEEYDKLVDDVADVYATEDEPEDE